MEKELQLKYNEIKKRYDFIDLNRRENIVRKLVKDKERSILWQYLLYEVKPLLDEFQPKDAEIVREYFRLIYKTVLGDTNLIKSGFKIVTR